MEMSSMGTAKEIWAPNWATHPGEHLEEYIEARGWSQAEFARIADLTPKLVSTIIAGKNPITPETAIKLERVLDVRAQVWLNLQMNWDLHQVRVGEESKASSSAAQSWLGNFPILDLRKRGALPATRDESALVDGLLAFLGIGSPDSFDAKFASLAVRHRQTKAYVSSQYSVYSWLKLGENKARALDIPEFSEGRFLTAVKTIRGLTTVRQDIFLEQMQSLCRAAGVALVFERPLPKTCIFGSARWLDGKRPVIQMSLRMKKNDHFWWTFFHEAAHIVLHRGVNFMDDETGEGDDAEKEADEWAEDNLVGKTQFSEFKQAMPRFSESIVRGFAREVSIHPGIVVGMLQHAKVLPYGHLNKLKEDIVWPIEGTIAA
jgi:HTH-type transcriptional regulator/antitoxin HigA